MASQFPFFPRSPVPGNSFNIDQAYQQALALHRAGQIQNAANLYQQILRKKPEHAGSLHMLGVVALSSSAFAKAKELLTEARRLLPQDAGVHVNLALALAECGLTDEALQCIDEALALNPAMPAARINRLALLVKAGCHDMALQDADALAAAGIDHPEVQINRGIALLELQRPKEAAHCFEQVLQSAPQHAKAHNNLAKTLIVLEQFDTAIAHANQALSVQPNYPDAVSTKARALVKQRLFPDAEVLLRNALEALPPTPALLLDHANCLIDLRRFNDAIKQVERALAGDPKNATAYVVGGRALAEMGRPEDAIQNFDKALVLDPSLKSARIARANSQVVLKRFEQAVFDLEQGAADLTQIIPIQMQICDWQKYSITGNHISRAAAEKSCSPGPFLAITDDPEVHLQIAQAHLDQLGLRRALNVSTPCRRLGKIRIGYFSADYCNHATTYLITELLSIHDRSRFEIHAFSYGPQRHDAAREKIIQSVDNFHNISSMSDSEAATLSRSLNIDIAVDLNGFTTNGRLGLFAERCAPIQVSYLGYPGTTGADYMDYVIADEIVVPLDKQRFFTEKLVYMPHSYQVNNSQRMISTRRFTRTELGLPENAFVFCCFNNNYKILPDTFDSWMRILQAVPDSVLWLLKDNDAAADNLRKEAATRGIHADRLVFAARMPTDEHLARHSAADLFLDTLPYNAHTTASDALWTCLPVLTLMGHSFAARVSASLLSAVNLKSLITQTRQEYEAKAIDLANHRDTLAAYRAQLHVQRQSSPLFDSKRFAHDLEAAYRVMMERYESGLPRETIVVPPSSLTGV